MALRHALARFQQSDRPNFRQRLDALRATASRLVPARGSKAPLFHTSREAPTDWADPPEGFMAYPPLAPRCFLALEYALPKEAQRLYRLARAEFERTTASGTVKADEVERRRRALRVDELKAAAYGQPVKEPPAEAQPSPVAPLADAILRARNHANNLLDVMPDAEKDQVFVDLAALEYELDTSIYLAA